jgi:excinuclease UvrABC nuclease subunit
VSPSPPGDEFNGFDIGDLFTADLEAVPRRPGVYILSATSQEFVYPNGRSRVFYIGQACNLRRRLRTRRRMLREARSNRRRRAYRPPHEYGAAFGAHCIYILVGLDQEPAELESMLICRFTTSFRGPPVANSTARWRDMA